MQSSGERGWSEREVVRLGAAVAKYGREWELVAAFVGSRSADECRDKYCELDEGLVPAPALPPLASSSSSFSLSSLPGSYPSPFSSSSSSLFALMSAEQQSAAQAQAAAMLSRRRSSDADSSRRAYSVGSYTSGDSMSSGATLDVPLSVDGLAALPRLDSLAVLQSVLHESASPQPSQLQLAPKQEPLEQAQLQQHEQDACGGGEHLLSSSLDTLATAACRLAGSSPIQKRTRAGSNGDNRKERSGRGLRAQSGEAASRVPLEPSTAAGSPHTSPELRPLRGNLSASSSSSSSDRSHSSSCTTRSTIDVNKGGRGRLNCSSNNNNSNNASSTTITIDKLKKRKNIKWTDEQVSRLVEGVQRYGRDWVEVAKVVGLRSNYDCLFKVKAEVKAGRMQEPTKGGRGTRSTLWTESETSLLYLAVRQFGRNWSAVSRVVGSRPAALCVQKYKNEVRSGRKPAPGQAVEPAQWTDAQSALLRHALERGADWLNLEQLLGGVFGEAEIRFKAAQLAEQDLEDVSDGSVDDGESASAAGEGDDGVDENDDDADGDDGKEHEA